MLGTLNMGLKEKHRNLEIKRKQLSIENTTLKNEQINHKTAIETLKIENEKMEKEMPTLREEKRKITQSNDAIYGQYKKVCDELEQVKRYNRQYDKMWKEYDKFLKIIPKDEKSMVESLNT